MDLFKQGKPKDKGDDLICRVPLTEDERRQVEKYGYVPRMSDITWRIFRIMSEFVEGFQFLSQLSKEVTILGSARTPADEKWYQEAERLGRLLAEGGFTVVTGGGPGIMEAANKGAHEAGGNSIGINIQLPREQRTNPYVNFSRGFHYFFTRKVILAASAQAYIYFPGGFGTLDELFEIVTLIQTKKSEPVPIVLVGKDYWSGLFARIEETLLKEHKTISLENLSLMTIVDSAEEAYGLIQNSTERTFF